MRLANPFTTYRRWRFRRLLAIIGVPHGLANDIYEIYCKDGRTEAERVAVQHLAAQWYYDLQRLDGIAN